MLNSECHVRLPVTVSLLNARFLANISVSGTAKTDLVLFKWGFGEGLLTNLPFSRLIKVLPLRGENCLQNVHFYKQKGPC